MKALSVKQPFAAFITDGHKTIEYRSWATKHRGPLLVCASASPSNIMVECDDGIDRVLPAGCMCCMVDLVGITGEPGAYEWHLSNVRPVAAKPVKGAVKLFDVADADIEPLPDGVDWLS